MKDIFDVLGISSREDSYTDLICNAFNIKEHKAFREKVLQFFEVEKRFAASAFMETRKVFNITDKTVHGRRKLSPDILLYLPENRQVILIENKVFSKEGYGQTLDYESILIDNYSIDYYYYMTLLGDMPESEKFIPIVWSKFVMATCPDCDFIEPYGGLIDSLIARATKLSDFIDNEVIASSTTLRELINTYEEKWIDRKIIFDAWMKQLNKSIVEKHPEIKPRIETAVSNAPQYLCIYSNSRWERVNLYQAKGTLQEKAKTRNVHIEFNWDTNERAVLFIHHESNPYLSTRKFMETFPEIYPIYVEKRERFRRKVHEILDLEKIEAFKKQNTLLCMAKYTFNSNTDLKSFLDLSFDEFKETFEEVFNQGSQLIKMAFEGMDND